MPHVSFHSPISHSFPCPHQSFLCPVSFLPLAPSQLFENASLLLDFLPAGAGAAVDLGGRDTAALLTHRPHVLEGFQAVDRLLGGAKAAQVDEYAAQAACIVMHVRVVWGRGLESFSTEPVGEGCHAAGPVSIWPRACDLCQAGASVVTIEKIGVERTEIQ